MPACERSLCNAVCIQEAMPQAIGESAGGGGLPSPPRGGPPPGGTPNLPQAMIGQCMNVCCNHTPAAIVGQSARTVVLVVSWLLDFWLWKSLPSCMCSMLRPYHLGVSRPAVPCAAGGPPAGGPPGGGGGMGVPESSAGGDGIDDDLQERLNALRRS